MYYIVSLPKLDLHICFWSSCTVRNITVKFILLNVKRRKVQWHLQVHIFKKCETLVNINFSSRNDGMAKVQIQKTFGLNMNVWFQSLVSNCTLSTNLSFLYVSWLQFCSMFNKKNTSQSTALAVLLPSVFSPTDVIWSTDQ